LCKTPTEKPDTNNIAMPLAKKIPATIVIAKYKNNTKNNIVLGKDNGKQK